ncbi:non-specific lipid transfer protein GPI-anchored 12-like [Bidens hawaiensis]|uniref:non-specific lipid transfer protein GPI-anchored 12-like n=1 Tax=Bidens hawaiensis TaxID=980011 RepID=UPI004049FFDB
MIKSNTTIMMLGIIVVLFSTWLPCLEALSPMGAPMLSPGIPISAPTPAPDCITVLANVSDCLSFVSIGSNLTKPDKPCCPEVAGLLESNANCLCQLVGQAKDFGVDINRAVLLPDACKLAFPSSVASCLGGSSPTSAPTPSSGSGTPGSPLAGPGPGGAASSPSGNGGSNGASGTAVHDLSTIVCLAVAIFIAYYF